MVHMKASTAAIDTGTSLIVGPASIIDEINQSITADAENGTIECSKLSSLPSITFTFGGRDFVLEGKDYIVKLNIGGNDYCMSGFSSLEQDFSMNSLWIVGDVFLRKYYSIYDFGNASRGPRVGFANSI